MLVKRVAVAAERNKLPILEVLREVLPRSGRVLEIASGTGQHAEFFASELAPLEWQPSDRDPEAIASIRAYVAEAASGNLLPPLTIDVTHPIWPIQQADAIVCINLIHISPWAATLGLLSGAARLLPQGGVLVLYGPYSIDGDFTAESNIAFDARLRVEDPEWGVRELRDVERAANQLGLVLERVVPRPANNHVVVFRRQLT